jgi:hypothetical protein
MCGRYITAQAAAFEKAIRLGKSEEIARPNKTSLARGLAGIFGSARVT